MGEKLTKAQRELLAQAEYGVHCVKAYKPAQRLVALGLAEWRDDDDYGGILDATPAGRAALTPLEGGAGFKGGSTA